MEYLEEKNGQLLIKKEYADKLKETKKLLDTTTTEYKALTKAIQEEIASQNVDRTTKVGDYNYVVKGGDYSFKFDEDKFKAEMPHIYALYCVPTYNKVSAYIQVVAREKKNNE